MCKNLDGENLANFGQSSISPNFSGAKVSLYTVCNVVVLFLLSVEMFDIPATKSIRIYLKSAGLFYKCKEN